MKVRDERKRSEIIKFVVAIGILIGASPLIGELVIAALNSIFVDFGHFAPEMNYVHCVKKLMTDHDRQILTVFALLLIVCALLSWTTRAASSTAPATDTAATDAAYTDAPATDAVPTDTSAASTSPNRPSFEPDATAEIETTDAVSPRESASAQSSDRTKSGSHVFDVVIAAAAVCLLGTAAYFVIKKRNRRQ